MHTLLVQWMVDGAEELSSVDRVRNTQRGQTNLKVDRSDVKVAGIHYMRAAQDQSWPSFGEAYVQQWPTFDWNDDDDAEMCFSSRNYIKSNINRKVVYYV